MGDWAKRQFTLQNIFALVTLLAVVWGRTAGWADDVTTSTRETLRAVQEVQKAQQLSAGQIEAMTVRVNDLEMLRVGLNDEVSKTFVRKAELEPRLRSLEEKLQEQSMMIRRLLERPYRAQGQ